jgi:ribosomal peptide maturation radical SAM protein 1
VNTINRGHVLRPHARESNASPAAVQGARLEWPVALVCMPFISVYRPSLQLGLLKAIAKVHGFQVTTFHLNLDLAAQIGTNLYEQFVHHRGRMFGDWLFSVAAFDGAAPDHEGRLADAFPEEMNMLLKDLGHGREKLVEVRQTEVPRYLDRLLEVIPWHTFHVVGFTSTFQQNVASFALATRLKQRFPGLVTVFGGANFEGEMGLELVRGIDCVDYAVIGEGDQAWPELLTALYDGTDPAQVQGVVTRRAKTVTALSARSPFNALDDLPAPDYGEFFERAAMLDVIPDMSRRPVYLPFESARGCWWGQKHHCTFCGLNGSTMMFRRKSPSRVLAELSELSQRYRSFKFEAVDNIVDASFHKTLFPRLTEEARDYEFFYEVKSNLTRDKLKILRQGGVRRIQPGIESLSTHVLQLMRKGVTAIQNVNTLRWSMYYDIDVGWNVIWGFPGETESDYAQQLSLLPHLAHLQPPTGAGRIWMERYSPIYMDRQTFPATFVRAEASYDYVYPASIDRDHVAYFFDYELQDRLPDEIYEPVRSAIRVWQTEWRAARRPTMLFWYSPGLLQIDDLRHPDSYGTFTFAEPLASIYVTCSDRPQTASSIRQGLQMDSPEDEIEDALNEFAARGLMMRDDKQFLSLALPASRWR